VNPDSYIPLYGNDFMAAVRGYPACVGMGYLRAIWHYWHHTHCAGIKNDDAYLQRTCELNDHEWEIAGPVIFGEFFQLGEDGLWHQGRAASEWAKSQEKCDRASAGAMARWKKKR
jgi:uncharacterized protein YdaU (DUF1376 family)